MKRALRILFVTIGAGLLISAFWQGYQQLQLVIHGKRVPGTVVEVRTKKILRHVVPDETDIGTGDFRTLREMEYLEMKVSYRDESGSKEAWLGTNKQRLSVGIEVPLLISKSGRVTVFSFWAVWIIPVGFFVLGIASFAALESLKDREIRDA